HISEIVQARWLHIIVAMVATVFIFKEAVRRFPRFAYFVDKYMLKFPIIGQILYLSVMARFARTLSTTFAAGVPLIDALTSVAGAAGNRVYANAIIKVRDDV